VGVVSGSSRSDVESESYSCGRPEPQEVCEVRAWKASAQVKEYYRHAHSRFQNRQLGINRDVVRQKAEEAYTHTYDSCARPKPASDEDDDDE